jgi:hypothetical protein
VEKQRRAGWEPRRPGRPLYILALGTEGTGHHALRSLLRGVADQEIVYNPKLFLAPGQQFVVNLPSLTTTFSSLGGLTPASLEDTKRGRGGR